MNTALIIHLLTLVEHHIHGRHFQAFIVPECFQWVKVRASSATHAPAQMIGARRLICGVIEVTQRSATVRWR